MKLQVFVQVCNLDMLMPLKTCGHIYCFMLTVFHIICIVYWVGELLMGVQGVASPRASFPPHFLKTVVEVNASGS